MTHEMLRGGELLQRSRLARAPIAAAPVHLRMIARPIPGGGALRVKAAPSKFLVNARKFSAPEDCEKIQFGRANRARFRALRRVGTAAGLDGGGVGRTTVRRVDRQARLLGAGGNPGEGTTFCFTLGPGEEA